MVGTHTCTASHTVTSKAGQQIVLSTIRTSTQTTMGKISQAYLRYVTHKCWARNIPLMSSCNSNQKQEAGRSKRETLLPTSLQDSCFWRESLAYTSWLQSPYTAQDDLELLSNAKIRGVHHHHSYSVWCWEWNPGPCACETTTLPKQPHLQPSHWTLLLKGSIKPQLAPQKPRPLSMEPLTHAEAQWHPSRV